MTFFKKTLRKFSLNCVCVIKQACIVFSVRLLEQLWEQLCGKSSDLQLLCEADSPFSRCLTKRHFSTKGRRRRCIVVNLTAGCRSLVYSQSIQTSAHYWKRSPAIDRSRVTLTATDSDRIGGFFVYLFCFRNMEYFVILKDHHNSVTVFIIVPYLKTCIQDGCIRLWYEKTRLQLRLCQIRLTVCNL